MDAVYVLSQAERAEDLLSRMDEAIYHLKEALEQIQGQSCRASEFLNSIKDAIDAAQDDKRECESAIAEAQEIEDRAMIREYEGARL